MTQQLIVSILRSNGTHYQRFADNQAEAETIVDQARLAGQNPVILPAKWLRPRNRGDRN